MKKKMISSILINGSLVNRGIKRNIYFLGMVDMAKACGLDITLIEGDSILVDYVFYKNIIIDEVEYTYNINKEIFE